MVLTTGFKPRIHGGPDGGPTIRYDFSTNANPIGPAPFISQVLQHADREHYPDPDYQALRNQLANWHHTYAERIIIAASAGEWIWRLTHWLTMQRQIRRVCIPDPGYGEYQIAAQRLGVPVYGYHQPSELIDVIQDGDLIWCCEPCNPTGQASKRSVLEALIEKIQRVGAQLVFDLAYAPLQLDGEPLAADLDTANVWRMWSPNKACALTGVRGAYIIAPPDAEAQAEHLTGFAPSWVLGVDGETMLSSFATQQSAEWLSQSRQTMADWRHQLQQGLTEAGWEWRPTVTHFMLARPPIPVDTVPYWLQTLRIQHGIKLRDTTSFGLPGWVRLRSMQPEAQMLLLDGWNSALADTTQKD